MRTGSQSMCGCYYVPSVDAYNTKKYLPQIELKAHTTVFSTASRTVLSQTFVNPSLYTGIKECKYTFPLYDGVSVVGFTCQVGSRIIIGSVKEKHKAKENYNAAVERGETAGLLEQGPTSDVFMTSLGNIPAGEKISVTLTYIGELKHDAGIDGIRFTIPTRISPRYGHAGMDETDSTFSEGGIAITVDVNMPEDCPIQELRSPSHPIAVALGRTSTSESQPPHLSKASATLSLGSSTLDKDFVLEIAHQDSGKAKALLEIHPTVSGQRALMATLVPKTPVQQSKPEVIFVADQSGSMRGPRTKTLTAALRVFLKSLPVGIKFNICYFGTYHSFLFPESPLYDQNSLEKALKSLDGLDGNHGGTETLSALKASVASRDNNQSLSIILATDGDIWQQQELFDYLNNSVATTKKTLRVFALGIGDSVSSALIEGVARAGNGFAQSVGEGEKLDGKVIRMLRGALTPDYGPFTMEIQYQKSDEEDDFVMVERVSDSLRVLAFDEVDWSDAQLGDAPIAFVDTTAVGEKGVKVPDADGQVRYSHLPALSAPKLMQTPQNIPPLFPFNRTNVYILISPKAAQGIIKSVILKGSSPEQPFELEIPIEVLSERGETIHQLASKKAVKELEEGRGWLVHAKDEQGVFIKEKFSMCFQSMVEREAVRIGVQYQIAGRFTSFVATETDPENSENTVSRETGIFGEARTTQQHLRAPSAVKFKRVSNLSAFSAPMSDQSSGLFGSVQSSIGSLFGASGSAINNFSAPMPSESSGLFGSVQSSTGSLFGASSSASRVSAQYFHRSRGPSSSTMGSGQPSQARRATGGQAPRMQLASKAASAYSAPMAQNAIMSEGVDEEVEEEVQEEVEETDPLQKIISLQTFEGHWTLDAPLMEIVRLSPTPVQGVDSEVWATVLAITFLKIKLAGDKEAWEMVVEKARSWLKDMEEKGHGEVSVEMWTVAEQLIKGAE